MTASRRSILSATLALAAAPPLAGRAQGQTTGPQPSSTRDLIDPQLREMADLIERLPAAAPDDFAALRRSIAEYVPQPSSYARPDVTISERRAPGPRGAPDVRLLLYQPTATAGLKPAVVQIHGGGYVAGTADVEGAACVALASGLKAVVVNVDYRLAPETRAPGAVEDCYAALRWLYAHADSLGVDRRRIAVSGGSAGGGLAAALAILARDRGEVPLRFQCLTYPMLDDRTVGRPGLNPYVGRYVWTPEQNRAGWTAMLGVPPGSAHVPPYAVPARTTDLAGLPPAYIVVGSLDLFLQEDVAYAMALLQARVPTQLHVVPGAFHGFEAWPTAPVSIAIRRERLEALARGLALADTR